MGRKRVIDQDQILDAAEAVVARDGASRLTLEAVAAAAGISKASVIYDFKSKQALIEAVVARAVRHDNAFNAGMIALRDGAPNAVIHGRIDAAAAPLPDEFRAVALNLCAALAQDRQLRQAIQANQAAVIDSIRQTSPKPRSALLAYLALEGLKLLESLDYHSWPGDERARILADIHSLADLPLDAVPATKPGNKP
jgi:AcrR family transcriptional regulator